MNKHVYNLVFGFMFTLLCFTTQAQEYSYIPIVKPGLQIWTCIASSEGFHHYNRFALTEEDTIMENETYKKLYFFTDSVFNPLTAECIGGLRENEQKQVFYKGKVGYNYENWFNGRICDFSLSIGDTFHLIFDNQLFFEVLDIDTVEINGIQRIRMSMGISNYEVLKFIEGIGNNFGLLFDNMMSFITGGGNGKLLCYEHNGELQYMADDISSCSNPYLSLEDMKINDNSITIYPNPARSEINISSESIINSIEIYNTLGQKVYQTMVNNKSKNIDINSLSKGIYIIGITTDKGYINKKLIVE